jgi:hypothetical protein
MREEAVMSSGGILLTLVGLGVGVSITLALLFRFWPRYGSVEAAIEHTDQVLDHMEAIHTAP